MQIIFDGHIYLAAYVLSGVSFSWRSQHPTMQFEQSMQCVFTTWPVAPTPWGKGGHVPPTFTNVWAWGRHH